MLSPLAQAAPQTLLLYTAGIKETLAGSALAVPPHTEHSCFNVSKVSVWVFPNFELFF